jgi:hypothetical protein
MRCLFPLPQKTLRTQIHLDLGFSPSSGPWLHRRLACHVSRWISTFKIFGRINKRVLPNIRPTSDCRLDFQRELAGRSVCAGSRNPQASRNNYYNNFESNYPIPCDSRRNVVQTQPPPERRIKYLGPLYGPKTDELRLRILRRTGRSPASVASTQYSGSPSKPSTATSPYAPSHLVAWFYRGR